ncbi:MAG: glycosyltransferase family 4 protein [Steroidobacteraceae bacterium]
MSEVARAPDMTWPGGGCPSICLVAELPPPAGGMAVQAERLGRALRAQGHSLRNVRTNALAHGSPVRRVPGLRGIVNWALYAPRLLVGTLRCRILHVFSNSGLSFFLFSMPAIVFGRLAGRRVVVHYHGGAAQEFLAAAAGIVVPLLRLAHVIVVPSPFLRRVFDRYGIAVVEIANLVTLVDPSARPTSRPNPRLLTARNLTPVYNIACALRTFARVCQRFAHAELLVAGDGPERGKLERLAGRLGVLDRVRFLGSIDNARLRELMCECDVLVNTSRTDNQPVSVMEAFASGLPVVSTNVGGIPDLVTDGVDGLLAADDDDEALAAAILRLLDSDELRSRITASARQRALQFSWPHIYPALGLAYGGLAST